MPMAGLKVKRGFMQRLPIGCRKHSGLGIGGLNRHHVQLGIDEFVVY